jgi:hypothetical protein
MQACNEAALVGDLVTLDRDYLSWVEMLLNVLFS